ncbi:MAG: DUF1217 domain-containing protein [Pseudomonadota bacterium]
MSFLPITLGSGLSGYNYLTRTRDQQQAIFDRDTLNAREVGIAAEKLQNVQTADDLMADRTLLKVTLGAFGLDEDINNRAFIKKILESDLSDNQSLANRLTDKRYLSLAQAFNFAGPDGPRLPNERTSDALIAQLESLEGADDLLSDRSLLRASLERFGLEDNLQNTYFLKQALESDLSDPTSFANRMGDERLVEFAATFDFFQKGLESAEQKTPIGDLIDLFGPELASLTSAEDLMAQPELFEGALNIFGLEDIYTDQFFEDVLNSDLNDSGSFANTLDDPRFALLAAAFNFATPELDVNDAPVLDDQGDPVFRTGNLETFLTAFADKTDPLQSPDDLLRNVTLREVAFDLLGLPNTFAGRGLASRVLSSNLDDPGSFANQFPDPQYKTLSSLFTVEQPKTSRTYPDGFVDQVVRNYLDRQFEIRVGEVEPDMRVALSLERELTQVVKNASGNDARWFAVMASPPLRQAFEGAFRLPSSFGSIDIDQQLLELKSRSEQFFGTSNLSDFLETDRLDELRQSYLLTRSIQSIGTTSNASAASIILSGF